MSWSNLKTDIVSLLGDLSNVSEVTSNPNADFKGFPTVVVVQSNMESETETSRENLRIYIFDLLIYYDAKNGVDDGINKIEELVDIITDKIDQEEKRGQTRTIGNSLDSDYHIMNVKPIIGPFTFDDARDLVVGQMSLQISVSYFVET